MRKKMIEKDKIERDFRKKIRMINIVIFVIQGLIYGMIFFFFVMIIIAVYQEIKR